MGIVLSRIVDMSPNTVRACHRCHCCCCEQWKREVKERRKDDPIEKLILAATEYVKAETEYRKEENVRGRRRKRRSKEDKDDKKDSNIGNGVKVNAVTNTSRNSSAERRRIRKGKSPVQHHSPPGNVNPDDGDGQSEQEEPPQGLAGMRPRAPLSLQPHNNPMVAAHCESCISSP